MQPIAYQYITRTACRQRGARSSCKTLELNDLHFTGKIKEKGDDRKVISFYCVGIKPEISQRVRFS